MAARGNRERRGGALKSPCRSDTYMSSENQQRFPASATAAWNTQSHLHGGSSFSNSNGGGYDEPEAKRQRRIAKYKAYAVESKLKASLRTGIRWVKIKCSELLHRWSLIQWFTISQIYLTFFFFFLKFLYFDSSSFAN